MNPREQARLLLEDALVLLDELGEHAAGAFVASAIELIRAAPDPDAGTRWN